MPGGRPSSVLQVTFTPSTREVRFEASGDVFASLAAGARSGEAELRCDRLIEEAGNADEPALDLRDPDLDAELALPMVVIQRAADPLTAVSLRVMSPGLVIRGGEERLELLARDFDQLSKAEPRGRLVAEWFPGHAYLIANSVPTVFVLPD